MTRREATRERFSHGAATAAPQKFSMLLVAVLFTRNIDLQSGFWGFTENSAFKLECYKPAKASKAPKQRGEKKSLWKKRVRMYEARLTKWTTKVVEFRQKQTKQLAGVPGQLARLYSNNSIDYSSRRRLAVPCTVTLSILP